MMFWLTALALGVPGAVEVDSSLTWTVPGTAPVPGAPWWTRMDDPRLEQVVADSLARNGDVAAAWDRVRAARGVVMQSGSALLPVASFEAGINGTAYENSLCWQISQGSAFSGVFEALAEDPASVLTDPEAFSGSAGPTPDLCGTASATFVAGWQPDLFGRSTLTWQASVHEAKATKGDRDSQTLALVAAVANAWYDAVAATEQVGILERQLQAQRDLLELVQLRFDQGGLRGVDVLQQRQQVAATEALLPGARAARETFVRQLASLTGRSPGATLEVSSALPDVAELPETGTPADLVDGQPGLVASAERVKGARDARLAAQLGLLPTVRLSGQAGWSGYFDEGLQTWPAWGIGASMSVPLFNGGAVHGRIRQARATEHLAESVYDQALRTQIASVDAAILSDVAQRARYAATAQQESAARAAYGDARERYLEGLDSYLVVLTSQTSLQAAELALLQAHRDALRARIQLHDALGAELPSAGRGTQ